MQQERTAGRTHIIAHDGAKQGPSIWNSWDDRESWQGVSGKVVVTVRKIMDYTVSAGWLDMQYDDDGT